MAFAALGMLLSASLALTAFLEVFEYRFLLLGTCLFIATWLVFVKPKVIFDDQSVLIVNPLNSVKAGWGAVELIDAKNSFFVRVGGKNYYAWAAPSATRYASRGIHESELKGLGLNTDFGIRAGQSPRSQSGVALALASRYFNDSKRLNNEFAFNRSLNGYVLTVLAATSFVFALV